MATRERFGKFPDSVMQAKDLTDASKIVYAFLARHAFRDGLCTIGQREIAEQLTKSQRGVGKCIKLLVSRGYIESTGSWSRGHRSGYKLLSTAFLPSERKAFVRKKAQQARPSQTALASATVNSRAIIDEILA